MVLSLRRLLNHVTYWFKNTLIDCRQLILNVYLLNKYGLCWRENVVNNTHNRNFWVRLTVLIRWEGVDLTTFVMKNTLKCMSKAYPLGASDTYDSIVDDINRSVILVWFWATFPFLKISSTTLESRRPNPSHTITKTIS